MESFLRRRDLPSFCRRAKSTTDATLQYLTTASASIPRGRAFILNTFDHLEGPALSHIRSKVNPITYALGPLHALLTTHDRVAAPSSSASASMWEEDRSCIPWLDAQPHRSVVYVSFGSAANIGKEELLEFWHGLIDSGHRFLWVIRPDLVGEDTATTGAKIPPEVAEGTRERGCLVGWAPQGMVLNHPAVGCFLTHSGWNSTVESITAGVPMICRPFFSDQQINSRFVGEVWKVGLDMKDRGGRFDVQKMVREAMEGQSAEKLRRSVTSMAKMARRSAEEGGTSYIDFYRLIEHIKGIT